MLNMLYLITVQQPISNCCKLYYWKQNSGSVFYIIMALKSTIPL